MLRPKLLVAIAVIGFASSVVGQTPHLKVTDTFRIQSSGGWDYITVDELSDRLYVSHGSQVNVLNKKNGDSIGIIPNTGGVHGIALVHSLNKGYTSNGRLNNVTVFDLKTGEVKKQISTGENPDAVFYDDYAKKIITCNGRTNNLTVIDPATDVVTATIPVGGKPETAVSDGAGKVFVNNEDKSTIEVVDIISGKVVQSWPIAPGESPTGLSIDRTTKRLFAACGNKLLMVIDATNGKLVAQVPIGDGCDGVAFDPSTKLIYTSNGQSGNMTVIKEVTNNKFDVIENVPTKAGARTICIDTKTHTLYLPTANFGVAEAGARRPPMVPGTFKVLVVK